ncbi:MAG: phosphotransferase [Myxococcales bacterium]|nr:phosphotransferase [Myxococcales bacterium]
MGVGAEVPAGLCELLASLFPGARIQGVRALAADTGTGATGKAAGYGRPLAVELEQTSGERRWLVLRWATSDEYGHDRRADRAAGLILAYDTYREMPRHVKALDVGAIADGQLLSLRGTGEFYLLTEFARGVPYAEDLRRIAREASATSLDHLRCEALARYLAELHARKMDDAPAYRRAVRDLLGHGEGIFGIVDGYPPRVPGTSAARLRHLEERCLAWRWRLRGREGRLARTHGDFHPFNILFEEGARFTALDASRGGRGEPADDVTALAINYVFFALEQPARCAGLMSLWRHFWSAYLELSGDRLLLEVAAPFFAWRALVVSSPRFYPAFPAEARDALLSLAERALEAPSFDPSWAEELFP